MGIHVHVLYMYVHSMFTVAWLPSINNHGLLPNIGIILSPAFSA